MLPQIRRHLSGNAGYISLIGLVAATSVWLQLEGNASTAKLDIQPTPINAVAALPAGQNISVPLLGQITREHTAVLSSGLEATVVQVLVSAGQQVKKGQPLVQLDPRQAKARADEIKSQLTERQLQQQQLKQEFGFHQQSLNQLRQQTRIARQRLQRTDDLHQRKLASADALDQQRQTTLSLEQQLTDMEKLNQSFELEQARFTRQIEQYRAKLRSQLVELEHARVTAPDDGVIVTVTATVGENLSKGAALLRFRAINQTELKVTIPHRWLPILQQSPTDQITVSIADQILSLNRIADYLDDRNGMLNSYFSAPAGAQYSEGRWLEVSLNFPAPSHWRELPRTALQPDGSIYQVTNNQLQQLFPKHLTADDRLYLIDKAENRSPFLNGYLPGAFNGMSVAVAEKDPTDD